MSNTSSCTFIPSGNNQTVFATSTLQQLSSARSTTLAILVAGPEVVYRFIQLDR